MKRQKFWIFLGVLMLVFGATGMMMDKFHLPGFSCRGSDDVVYQERNGITYPEAQEIYRQAGDALRSHQPDQALALYGKIQDGYMRLRPLILLHEAEAYVQLGNEAKAQSLLKTVTREYPDSFLEGLAQYELGKSHIRANEPDQADDVFNALVSKSPDSNITLGAHYYLGEISMTLNQPSHAETHWRTYLKESPQGTFSIPAAKGLMSMATDRHPDDNQGIGLALYYQDKSKEALPYLQGAPFEHVWVELGKAYIRSGYSASGVAVLERGLHVSVPDEQAQVAVRAIMSVYPSTSQKTVKLNQMLKTNPKSGGDFMLWQLQKLSDGATRSAYGQQLLDRYPKSIWGPETSWSLMWPLYKSGNHEAFLARAERHLQHFPHSVSAPRVMFWKAKLLLAQGQTETAHRVLKNLTEAYPYQYYAFRAKQILEGESNPWLTSPENAYPPENPQDLDVEAIAMTIGDKKSVPIAAELIKAQCPEDIQLLLSAEKHDKKAGPLDSVALQLQQQNAQSIRTIRDYLDEKRKTGKVEREESLYKLLYPVLFTDEISRYARQNNLDPFLVQALMRQESYFNPLAVSSSRAMGLMQLLPSTAQDVAKWESLSGFSSPALFTPAVNVQLGTRYLRFLHTKFNGNSMMSVGAYNGGPGAMERWVKASSVVNSDPDLFIESIPYEQSRDYIKEVFSHYWNYKRLYAAS